MNTMTKQPPWTAEGFTNPPRCGAIRPMIGMSDLEPAGGKPWSGVKPFASLGYAGGVMSVPDWYHHPEQRAGIFQSLRAILAEADTAGLPLFLMDDFAYPSATAGGEIIRRNAEHRAKGLFFVLFKGGYFPHMEGGADFFADMPEGSVKRIFLLPASPTGQYDLEAVKEAEFTTWSHACYRVALPVGRWHVAALIERDQYEGTYGERLNYGMRRVTNLLDPLAMESYLDCIHRTYLDEVGDCFGRGLAGFFSEEIETAGVPATWEVFPSVPWHDGLIEACAGRGFDVYRALLALFLDDKTPAGMSLRYRFWRCLEARIDDCCFSRIRRFCDDQRVTWTGHMIAHDGPFYQIPFHGPLTRVLRRLHVPGTDFILKGEGALTSRKDGRGPGAKLVASTAWLSGCEDSIAEANACVDSWRGQRASFTFHLAMGITIMNTFSWRTWSEDAEMAKRMNAYAARVASFLKTGRPVRSAALLCPFGDLMAFLRIGTEPFLGTQPEGVSIPQNAYHDGAWELLAHQCDYAVVDEQFLQEGRVKDGYLDIGPGRFRSVLLPTLKILEAGTWERLAEFSAAGGRVIIQGEGPAFVMGPDGSMRDIRSVPRLEAVHCGSAAEWISRCVREARPLLECAEPAPNLYIQARQDGRIQRRLLANMEWEQKQYCLRTAPGMRLVVYDPWLATVAECRADADGRLNVTIDGGSAVIIENEAEVEG